MVDGERGAGDGARWLVVLQARDDLAQRHRDRLLLAGLARAACPAQLGRTVHRRRSHGCGRRRPSESPAGYARRRLAMVPGEELVGEWLRILGDHAPAAAPALVGDVHLATMRRSRLARRPRGERPGADRRVSRDPVDDEAAPVGRRRRNDLRVSRRSRSSVYWPRRDGTGYASLTRRGLVAALGLGGCDGAHRSPSWVLARRVRAVAPIPRTRSVRSSGGARPARRRSRATSTWQQPQLSVGVRGEAVANSPEVLEPALGACPRELAPKPTRVRVNRA